MTDEDIEIAKARSHLMVVANGLSLKFGPRLAATLLLGAAGGVIEGGVATGNTSVAPGVRRRIRAAHHRRASTASAEDRELTLDGSREQTRICCCARRRGGCPVASFGMKRSARQ